jgi:hypothetical protein
MYFTLETMAQRTVKTEQVKTLRDWVARWPKATNLGFDPETREATIYDTTKDRVKVASIPWKREGDTLTILAQPTRFSPQAVEAATRRFDKIREQRAQLRAAAEDGIRAAEAALLDAWRQYNAAPPTVRGTLRRDILSAEATLRDLEEKAAPKGRDIIVRDDPDEKNGLLAAKTGIYVPPMPVGRRGISLAGSATEEPEVPATEADKS